MHKRNTFPLPPMADLSCGPEDIFSIEEMQTLTEWIRCTSGCRGVDDFNKATNSWSKERKAMVANMLSELRDRFYWPEGIDANGCIKWGIALKSRVQVEIERYSDEYLRRGNEIKMNLGYDDFQIVPVLRKMEYAGDFA